MVTYHYTESGLDDIFLENGFKSQQTPYGEGTAIEDTAGLSRAIGRWLIERPVPLNGAALRFLRLEMELTQRELADILGTKEQTLRLWERDRAAFIRAMADRLVRMVYADKVDEGGGTSVNERLRRLIEMDGANHKVTVFRRTRKAWTPKCARVGNPEQLSA